MAQLRDNLLLSDKKRKKDYFFTLGFNTSYLLLQRFKT